MQKAEEEKKSAERNAIKAKLIKGEHLSKEELAKEAAAAFEAMQQKKDKNKKPQLLKGQPVMQQPKAGPVAAKAAAVDVAPQKSALEEYKQLVKEKGKKISIPIDLSNVRQDVGSEDSLVDQS